MLWYDERINKDKQTKNPKFALCCGDGKIQLPVLQDGVSKFNFYFSNGESAMKS